MSFSYSNILSDEELQYLNNHPDVLAAKSTLDAKSSGMVYFSVPLTESIRDTLQTRFNIVLSADSIPMRWIKGDTAPHIDVGASAFDNTYLLYLNDSPGHLVIDSHSYSIQANTGFVFNEGLSHETQHTENIPRLLIGPMNELAEPVGRASGIFYYSTEAGAIMNDYQTELGYSGYTVYTVGEGGPFGGYTSWRIASSSAGTSSQSVVYTNGSLLNSDGNTAYYYLYPSAPCFLEGTTVLCQVDGVENYIPIQELKNGTLVKTSLSGYKPVVLLGKGIIQNPGDDKRTENRLYKYSPSIYPDLKEDLYITGCHSILEFPITDKQMENTIKHLGKLFITDNKYRLMACIDERAEPWNSEGEYTIWHVALENADEKMNYGIYVNGGLLVESCSINFLKNKSNMTIIA